ncbi:MAG: hypothetical protein AAFX85_15295, partial [Pseudomonadota bacterium]
MSALVQWRVGLMLVACAALCGVGYAQDQCAQEVAALSTVYASDAQDDGGGGSVVEQLQVALLAVGYD